MRSLSAPVLVALCALLASTAASAQSVKVGGHLSTQLQVGWDGCVTADEPCRYLDLRNTNVVGIKLRGELSSRVAARAWVDFRNLNFSQVETLDDTGEPERVQPVSLRVQEAYLDLYGFIFEAMDLRIGAQTVRWGTGDGINPTDRINPYDLEDPTVFDRRLATVAALAALQLGKVRIEVAWVPLFVPAALPVREVDFAVTMAPDDAFSLDDVAADDDGIELNEVNAKVQLPEFSLANTSLGARVLWSGPIGDLGISYYHGRDSLPQADGEALLTGFVTDTSRVDVSVPAVYPRIDVLGLEYRGGPFGKLTFWAEAALVFPETTELIASRSQLEALERLDIIDEVPDPLPTAATQNGKPYVQAIGGFDLTFDKGLYLNLQYLRGFPTERQAPDQANYVLGAVRYTLPGGKVVLSTRGGMEIRDEGELGYTVTPAVSVLFGDAVELEVGATWMGGQEGSSLRAFKDLSHIKLAASAEF